jgi:glycopeptide antibiotics resistance protein
VHRLAAAAFVGYLALLGYVVLSPSSDRPASVVSQLASFAVAHGAPPSLVSFSHLEFAFNAAMTVPVSLIGAIVLPRWSWQEWTTYALLAAAGVETVQAVLLPGRDPSWRDVVANTAGVLVGAVLVRLLRPMLSGANTKRG